MSPCSRPCNICSLIILKDEIRNIYGTSDRPWFRVVLTRDKRVNKCQFIIPSALTNGSDDDRVQQ
jgi:hypothetical protein